MIYISIALIILSCHFISMQKKIKYLDNSIFFLISVALIVLAATRENIGLDFVSYQEIFETTKELLKKYSYNRIFNIDYSINDMEFLYRLLNIVLPNFKLLLAIMALLGVGIKCFYIGKYCESKFFCLFLYFTEYLLYYDMGVMRQGVAISFMLLAVLCIEKKKPALFWLNVLLASLFHITAILLVPFYFIAYRKIKTKQMFFCIYILIPIVFLDFQRLILYIAELFRQPHILLKLETYFSGKNILSYGAIFESVFIFFLYIYIIEKEKINNEKIYLYLKCNWYGIIFMLIFSFNSFLMVRGTSFFSFVRILIIDQIFRKSKKSKLSILIMIFFACLYFRTLLQVIPGSPGNNFQSYSPYNSYLF